MKKLLIAILTVLMGSYFIGCGGFSGGSNVSSDIPDTVTEVRSIKCTLCQGGKVCYHCNGDAFRNGRRCSVCNGEGNCDRCGGAGSLEVFVIDGQDYIRCSCEVAGKCDFCKSVLFSSSGTCSMCRGTGKCRTCNGTGYAKLSGF